MLRAGPGRGRSGTFLIWLVETVQGVVEMPLSIDTANARALKAALSRVARTPLVNSISGEPGRLEDVLPQAAAAGCPVVALALDENGIPAGAAERLAVIRRLSRTMT